MGVGLGTALFNIGPVGINKQRSLAGLKWRYHSSRLQIRRVDLIKQEQRGICHGEISYEHNINTKTVELKQNVQIRRSGPAEWMP